MASGCDSIEESQSENEDCLSLGSPKKRKRKRATTSKKTVNKAPSKTKWEDIQDIGIVTNYDFSQFKEDVLLVQKKADLIQSCESPELDHFEHCHSILVKKLYSDNEGFPSVKHSLLFSHLTNHMGDRYKLKIKYPIVKRECGQRKNKKSDYTVLQVRSQRTVLVYKLKFGISEEMSVLEDEFSQLLQEVRYAYDTDTRSSVNRYNYMLAILGDHLIWHILLINCFRKPYNIVESYVLHVKDVDLGILCFFCNSALLIYHNVIIIIILKTINNLGNLMI